MCCAWRAKCAVDTHAHQHLHNNNAQAQLLSTHGRPQWVNYLRDVSLLATPTTLSCCVGTARCRNRLHSNQHQHIPLTLYSVEVNENFSLNLTTVPSPSLFGRGSTLLVAPRRRLPRCQPMATALEPAGHGCRVWTCTLNSKRVALSRDFHFENMAGQRVVRRTRQLLLLLC